MSDLEFQLHKLRTHYAANRLDEEAMPFDRSFNMFDHVIDQVKADAWDEGAETAWKESGEGHNGEYTSLYGTHDGTAPFLLANEHVTNPYRKQEEAA